jgi:myo-inositol catabolism protein IolH
VKLALDPYMLRSVPLLELPGVVADLGYEHIELSPRDDFLPFFVHPRADRHTVAAFKKALAEAGVSVASVLPLYRWSGPDEDERQAAVRYWKRAIEITVELGVPVMNSEFNGRPEAQPESEAQFWRSLDELLPIFEREGVELILEPHPDDFIEDGIEAVEMIRGLNKDWLGFLYCTPHAFHQGHSPTKIISAAAEKTRYVHLADAWNHLTSNGLRYISNPPGNTARVHQHMEMGRGEVDYDEVFTALASVGFDGVISSCVFGWEEDADGVNARQREKAQALVDKHFSS